MKLAIELTPKSDNLIFMELKKMTATEVARNFSGVLDEVERGQEISIIRGKTQIARLIPNPDLAPNGAALKKALDKFLKANEALVKAPDDVWSEIETLDELADDSEDADTKYDRLMAERASDE